MPGWIKLSREIQSHWIYSEPLKFKWWITILLEANYVEGKTVLGNQIIKVEKGQSVKSLRTWALILNTTPKTVSLFFDTLSKEGMITKKIIGKGKQSSTLINITNYNYYQDDLETQCKRKVNAKETEATTLTTDNIRNKENIYRSFKHLEISNDEIEKLKNKFSIEEINEVLDRIENYSKNKNYTSLYLTANNWLKKKENSNETILTEKNEKIDIDWTLFENILKDFNKDPKFKLTSKDKGLVRHRIKSGYSKELLVYSMEEVRRRYMVNSEGEFNVSVQSMTDFKLLDYCQNELKNKKAINY